MHTALLYGCGGLAASLVAYLLGSICFAIPVSFLYIHKDIRTQGSGNAGMTNVLRCCGLSAAALTLIGDIGKAVAAVYIGRFLFGTITGVNGVFGGYLSGLFVMLGHMFPVYYKFKGGKGVLTAVGMLLVLNPTVLLLVLIVFALVLLLTKMVSASSICAAFALPFVAGTLAHVSKNPNQVFITIVVAVMGITVIFMHRGNIRRILEGTERKLSMKKKEK